MTPFNSERLNAAQHRAPEWPRHHPPTVTAPILDASVRREREDRITGAITDFAGSIRFVYIHTLWFGLWIVVNGGLLLAIGLGIVPFDPFPFGLLTLVVSLEAIYLSTFVMIAQNRQSAVADARAQADYAVNVRAEAEIAKLLHLVETLTGHQAELTDSVRTAITDPDEPDAERKRARITANN
jgi:uncharacterized membrane protein